MFKWESLRKVAAHTLRYRMGEIPGDTYDVALNDGKVIQVWRAKDGQQYFCHGLTFGGKQAPGGVISPYGKEVPALLHEYYEQVPEARAQAGDILVWYGLGGWRSRSLRDPHKTG